tara:strand:- start:6 stop:1124 length:1119 start_codon:yes stop_codon:yes gene_type:complete
MPLSLDGTGSITGIGTFNFSDEIVHVGDTNTKIRFPAADTFSVETNGAERLRIRSDGKVGIGTDMVGAPASNYAFGVYRASGTGYLYTEAGASSASAGLRAKAGTSDFTIFTTQGTGQLAVYDNTNSAERLRITSAGRIGINENSPDNILHIKDSNPFIELEGTTNNSGDIGIFLNANGNHWLLRADNYPSANAFTIKDGTPASSTHRLGVTAGSGNVTLYTGNLVIGTSGKGIDFSATANSAGTSTSELLDDYEEGSCVPTQINGSFTPSSADGKYTKVGRLVTWMMHINFDSTASNNHLTIGNLPFTAGSGRSGTAIVRYSNDDEAFKIAWHVDALNATATAYYLDGGAVVPSNAVSQKRFDLTFVYEAT